MQFARTLCLTLGLFAIAACGTSLEDACKEGCGRVCSGAEPLSADEINSCKSQCTMAAAATKKQGCEDEAEKVQTCDDEHACAADLNSQCSKFVADLARCRSSYCFDHLDDSSCNNQ